MESGSDQERSNNLVITKALRLQYPLKYKIYNMNSKIANVLKTYLSYFSHADISY